jgi:hypothetical protein
MFGPVELSRVIIESPYAGDTERNLRYLRACMRDCLKRDESPYASHGLYTQPGVLDDNDPIQREQGIEAGFAWRVCAHKTVFYVDLGWSSGMSRALEYCKRKGFPYETRSLLGEWAP